MHRFRFMQINPRGLPPVIVALTAISSRVAQLDRVIDSLLRQSIPPAKILLAVSEEPYMLDEGVRLEMLPARLTELAIAGRLDILFVPNTGPYRKLLPALRRYAGQERLIATADDDTVYPPHWLENMVETYRKKPAVVAYRCRAMPVIAGRFLPYSQWRMLPAGPEAFAEVPPAMHPLFTLPTGVRGVLYNSAFFPDLALLERLRQAAPRQDDLAFKAAAMVAGIPVAIVEAETGVAAPRFGSVQIAGETLFQQNKKHNDRAWSNIMALLEAEGLFNLVALLGLRVCPRT